MANRRRHFRSFCGATERIRNVLQTQPLILCFFLFLCFVGVCRVCRVWRNVRQVRCGLFPRCHNADAAAAALRDVATRCPQSTVDAKESAECGPREQVSRWAGGQRRALDNAVIYSGFVYVRFLFMFGRRQFSWRQLGLACDSGRD